MVVVPGAPAAAAPVQAVPASEAYRRPDGQTCREYQTAVQVGGRLQAAYGTTCLAPDGSWRVAGRWIAAGIMTGAVAAGVSFGLAVMPASYGVPGYGILHVAYAPSPLLAMVE
ncbi:hypothetical protein [Arenibaculum pallidiluteum]|uniref:hypothetical protein n=1 Tax=Arenibaculum pallidiluteum TaxID=2812559 RepID=UPI001A96A9A1|nr:hypothetical protein [Arenibaculum pallidiluteum]